MSVPEEIRKVERPPNTIVQDVHNKSGIKYIVRERNGQVYKNGRSMPKNGNTIGYIIDGRFVGISEAGKIDPKEVSMNTWAVERLALDTTPDIMEDLRKVYDEKDAETIYSMAILRVRHPGLKNSRMKRDYDESVLSQAFPSLSMSRNSVSGFLQKIGGAGNRIREFMKARGSRLPAGALLALDGMLQTDDSDVNNLSAVSRKSKVRGSGEISMLFAYDVADLEPVYFSAYPGNLIDSKAYADFIEENDIRDSILMGDKAFTFNAAKKQLKGDRNLHYLFPIRRNSKAISGFGLHRHDSALKTYKGVTFRVAYDIDEGIWYYSFRDAERAAEEETEYLGKLRRSGRGFTEETLSKKRETWGTMILQSDLRLPAEKIYDMYMSRWMIEEMFRMYKHIEEFDDTRVHSDFSVIGEKLINFISTIITSRFMNLFLNNGLLEKQTFGEVMDTLRRSLKFQTEDKEWVFRAQTDKEKEILRSLDLMQKLPPKRGPGRPRKNS